VIVFYRTPSLEGSEGVAKQVVAMEPTLSEALVSAFGEGLGNGSASGGTETGGATGDGTGGATGGATGGLSAQARDLIARANSEFQAAQDALRAGDFAEYGRRITALEQTLTDLQRLQQ
jgi:uncharacterized membrane protein (UPF0182 family)